MNWIVLIVGVLVAACVHMFTPDSLGIYPPSAAIMFATGTAFGLLTAKAKLVKPSPYPVELSKLHRLSIRMSYLMQEGTLSKTGDVVRFDAEGAEAANEFMDAVIEIGNLGR